MGLSLGRGLELHSGVELVGQGEGTILRKGPGRVYPLSGYHNYGMCDVPLVSAAGLAVGMTVSVLDDERLGFYETFARISWIDGHWVGSIVAAAPPGGDDWVELYNTDSRPAALFGLGWEAGLARFTYRNLSFIAPRSYQVFRADERPGVRHLDFRLPAAGGPLCSWAVATLPASSAEGASL